MKLELNDIHTMITWVAEQKLSLLEYQDADMRIKIGGQNDVCSREYGGNDDQNYMERLNGSVQANVGTLAESNFSGMDVPNNSGKTNSSDGNNIAPSASSESAVSFDVIKSPLVGTFFAAPSEDSEPYVRIGDAVKCGQVVGIVEAMKLMNEIEADCDGVVEEILVQNEQMVEYGQPLMRIRPETVSE